MEIPNINWPTRRAKREEILNAIAPMSRSDADALIEPSIVLAEAMSDAGVEHMRPVLALGNREIIAAWNADELLVRWFGEVTKASQAKTVNKRLKKVNARISESTLTFRVRPPDRVMPGSPAQNLGSFLSPKTFKIRPAFFLATERHRAATIIHELGHEWFLDQKLENGDTVYGPEKAKQLVEESTKKARKSTENYEQYCREVYP